jgi:acetyl esterase/lipase
MRPHAVLATLGLIASAAAAAGASLLVLPTISGRSGYYELLAGGSTVRLTALSLLGCLLGAVPTIFSSAHCPGRPRLVGSTALALGAVSAGLAAAVTAPVFGTARSLGVPISAADSLFGTGGAAFVEPALVTFAAGDGWHLDADVYRPRTTASGSLAPVVVVVHGGAWQRGDKGENVAWNHWLAERGCVVVDIQYRLAPAADWQTAVFDIQSALRWVRAHAAELDADPARITLLGRSAGGHLALLAAYASSGDAAPSAVVALYAPTDLTRLYDNAQGSQATDLRTGLQALMGGPPSVVPLGYEAASPVHLADHAVARTLLIHGTWDDVVPPVQSQILASALRAAGARIASVMVPNTRHSFDFVPDAPASQLARAAVLEFIAERLT